MPSTKKHRHRFDPVAPGPKKEGISPQNLAPEAQQLSLDLAGEGIAHIRLSLLPDRLAVAARWSLKDPRDTYRRLRWDVEQAGGLSQLAAACSVDRQVLADYQNLLQRRIQAGDAPGNEIREIEQVLSTYLHPWQEVANAA